VTARAFTDEFFQRPSDFYETFAAGGAAHRQDRVWVTSHRLCREALADPRLHSGLGEDGQDAAVNLLFLDGPEHARLRRAVAAAIAAGPTRQAFERGAVAAWERCWNRVRPHATIDLLADVAQPVACQAIGELVGFDPDESDALLPSLRAVTSAMEEFEPEPERAAGALASRELLSVVDERFADLERRGGFVASLGRAVVAGEITDFEAVSTTVTFLSAGFENSANFLAGAALHLLPGGARRAAGGEPDLEELLRLVSPAHVTVRRASEPLTIGPVEVPEGATVHVVLGAGNADPAAAGPAHLAFGHGPHVCIGAGLARVEMAALVSRIAALRPCATIVEAPTWRPRLEFRTMRSLQVALQV
jgi:cytochrome P450